MKNNAMENSKTVLKQLCEKSHKGERLIPWIAVSGLDGSGKTTLVDNLECYLRNHLGLRVKRSRLPHDEYLVGELLDLSSNRYTDRLLFALDNRLFAERYRKEWTKDMYDVLVTQRCYLDSYVFGSVQGYSYAEIGKINGIDDLPKCDVIIHLVADYKVAHRRISDDPDADKFEYPEFMQKQEIETRKAYAEVIKGDNPNLVSFKDTVHVFVDTTSLTTEQTFNRVLELLRAKNII